MIMDTADLRNTLHSKDEILAFCKSFAPDLAEFEGEKWKLLYALTGTETDFGRCNVPRFEPSYSRFSLAYQRSERLKSGYILYGDLVACSYGAHQLLWCVAAELGFPLSYNPLELWNSSVNLPYVIQFLNKIISKGATSVQEVGICWNTGIGGLANPNKNGLAYAQKLQAIYDNLK